jgi:hypothetical protein
MAQRDIVGLWDAIQTNGFVATINVDFVAPQGQFGIHAEHSEGTVHGQGIGQLIGSDQLHFTITWDNSTVGAYHGAFDDGDFINGSAFDIKNPGNVAGWRSSRSFALV